MSQYSKTYSRPTRQDARELLESLSHYGPDEATAIDMLLGVLRDAYDQGVDDTWDSITDRRPQSPKQTKFRGEWDE